MSIENNSRDGAGLFIPEPDAFASLYEAFVSTSSRRPKAELIISSQCGLDRIDISTLLERGNVVAANLLGMGLKKGDVIATQLPQGVELALTIIAAARIGAVLLSIVPNFGARELSFILSNSEAKIYVSPEVWREVNCIDRLRDAGDLPALSHHIVVSDSDVDESIVNWNELEKDPSEPAIFADIAYNDVAVLIYTSGTTAEPKGVQHSHGSLLNEILPIAKLLFGDGEEHVVMAPWPSGHIAGLMILMRYLLVGQKTILMEQWDPKVAAHLMEDYGASFGTGTPLHLSALLDAAENDKLELKKLRNFQCGAAPVPSSLVARCSERGIRTFRSYGSTEHPTSTYGSPDDPLEKRLSTEGRVAPGVDFATVDENLEFLPTGTEGEIVTRGPDLFVGYRDAQLNDEAFLTDGWYRSGDIGYLDRDGYLVLTDRKKDIIIRGGENISSREIENELHFHPAVVEVAVVAAPHPRLSEIACAFVVTKPGHEIDLESIRVFFAERKVSKFKTPERVEIVDSLPRNATGKVLKNILREGLRQ